VAGTAADYEGFGANLRLSNLAGDLTTAEKDAIRLKIGTAISPAPFLDEVIPDSYLPSTTGMFKLKGSFFTENMTVTTTGGTVNYIIFHNDNDVDVNITTGATEGSFSVTIDNGISKTFNGVLLIVLGTVFKPLTSEWTLTEPIDVLNDSVMVETYSIYGTAIWSREFDYTINWSFRFNLKRSPLGVQINDFNRNEISLINLSGIEKYGFTVYTVGSNATTRVDDGVNTILSDSFANFWNTVAEDSNIELRCVNGIVRTYVNSIVKTAYSGTLTENLKLKININSFDIENIKYIELS